MASSPLSWPVQAAGKLAAWVENSATWIFSWVTLLASPRAVSVSVLPVVEQVLWRPYPSHPASDHLKTSLWGTHSLWLLVIEFDDYFLIKNIDISVKEAKDEWYESWNNFCQLRTLCLGELSQLVVFEDGHFQFLGFKLRNLGRCFTELYWIRGAARTNNYLTEVRLISGLFEVTPSM